MNQFDLEKFIRENKIDAKIIEFDKPTKTVEEATKRLGCKKSQIIKSIVLVKENGDGLITIVDGESKVDLEKVSLFTGKVRMANAEEAKKLTGYEIGGVPPIGHGCQILIDEKVLENDIVYGGGGSICRIMSISPKELIKFGKVVNIRK